MQQRLKTVDPGCRVNIELSGRADGKTCREKIHVLGNETPGSWQALLSGRKLRDSVELPAGEGNVVSGKIISIARLR